MSLVDKLNDVNVGDLVCLDYINVPNINFVGVAVAGYVAAYTHDRIRLSNMSTRTKDGEIRDTSFLQQYHKEKIVTLNLDDFFSCEILKKYEAPKKEVTKD